VSPRVFQEGEFVFWFHSYDVLHEDRASVHVGKGSQNDAGDAKIWLEPEIEIGRAGRTLSRNDLEDVIKIVNRKLDRLKEAWNDHKRRAG
jgi:hypothetical protein